MDVVGGAQSKSQANQTVVHDNNDPSREVSRKRQSLSDIFTIVSLISMRIPYTWTYTDQSR